MATNFVLFLKTFLGFLAVLKTFSGWMIPLFIIITFLYLFKLVKYLKDYKELEDYYYFELSVYAFAFNFSLLFPNAFAIMKAINLIGVESIMLIKEIFEALTNEDKEQRRSVQELAKDLPIGEKALDKLLKTLGFFHVKSGHDKGWNFNGDSTIMDKSILDFIDVKTSNNEVIAKKKNNSSSKITTKIDNNSESKSNSNNASIEDSEKEINQDSRSNINVNSKNENDELAKVKALMYGDDSNNARKYRGIYFDSDIDNFLNSVKHGNKSEIVNTIIRAYLVENKLI